jgi:hypothetical protein
MITGGAINDGTTSFANANSYFTPTLELKGPAVVTVNQTVAKGGYQACTAINVGTCDAGAVATFINSVSIGMQTRYLCTHLCHVQAFGCES